MLNQKERTVITVIFNNKPYVFGSMAAIFEYFNNNELKVTYPTLRINMGKNKHFFSNDVCSITRSTLITKAMSIKHNYLKLNENL